MSSALAISGNAYLRSNSSVTPNAISVQIIRPTLGVTRNDPPPDAATGAEVRTAIAIDLEEERDQTEDERVKHDRFGEGEPEPLDGGDFVLHLRLAGDGLDDLAEDETDANARSDRAEAGADAEGHCLAGVLAVRGGVNRLGEGRDGGQIHEELLENWDQWDSETASPR